MSLDYHVPTDPLVRVNPADGVTLVNLVRDIWRGEVSPVELLEIHLESIAARDQIVEAFAFLDADLARAEARLRAQVLERGGRPGRLHGIPVGIKDIIDVKGIATKAGSEVTDRTPAATDAAVVAKLRAEGAVILGKTTTHEFAYGVVCQPTKNPWDRERIAGGSSGGSAAAVAAGFCSAALGTDTAGSIRIPSSLCGVSGLVPRWKAISMEGVVPLAPSLDRCGPIARSAEDLALLWSVMSDRPMAKVRSDFRIVRPRPCGSVVELGAGVADAVDSAYEVLAGAAISCAGIDIQPFNDWERPRVIPMMVEAAVAHAEAGWYPQRAQRYSSETRAYLQFGSKVSARTYFSAMSEITRLRSRFMEAWADADVLVLPATPITAPTVDEAILAESKSERRLVAMTLTRLCGPINYCDCAVVVVPCGRDEAGLPVGMQLVARDEETALGVAMAFQRETGHHLPSPWS